MLTDKKTFARVEENLEKQGVLAKWREEKGALQGRMMIARTKTIPPMVHLPEGEEVEGFVCSFDFADLVLGVGLSRETGEAVTDVWAVPQCAAPKAPDQEVSAFFTGMLMDAWRQGGDVQTPIVTFFFEKGSFSLAPKLK